MSRRHRAEKRVVHPDPKFGDKTVSKFMNYVMIHGKKPAAEKIVYGAFSRIEQKLRRPPVDLFKEALENVTPSIEVRPDRKIALAMRWIISAARSRNETTMVDKLSNELMDAAQNRGAAVKKREDTHRMAEANRAFSHYRW